MAITLHDKFAKQIQQKFTKESIAKGILSDQYSWAGVKTVKISTLQTVPLNDYTRTGANRYGEPVEMQDMVQELTLTQDKSFALTIDKGNQQDQNGIKAAGQALSLQIKERMVPALDTYVLAQLAQKAGKIVGNGTALTKTTVAGRIDDGVAFLDDAEVPEEGRTLLVSSGTFTLLKQSGVDLSCDEVVKKAWVKGKVGEYSGMNVVKVPAGRWPANVNFMIVHKNAGCAPVKLNDTKVHQDPPGLSGNLLEGRQYYDCFVFGAKCNGVYVEVNTGSSAGTVLAAPTIAAATGVITPASGATVKYTTDGTDPRYSNTAKVGTSAGTGVGTVVKAYQYKEGAYPSEVATVTLTA